MLLRSFTLILIVVSCCVIAIGQTPDGKNGNVDRPAKKLPVPGSNQLRDIPFPNGVDLQFMIKELARDLDLNVLFELESFRMPRRKTQIDLKNVTAAAALDHILLQEGLIFEEVGPRTILISSKSRVRRDIPQIGVKVDVVVDQLANYFGVKGGMLINTVFSGSSASKAGLKAGDVIIEIDSVPVIVPLVAIRLIDEKMEGDVTLTIVRDRKHMTVDVTPVKGINSVLLGNPSE